MSICGRPSIGGVSLIGVGGLWISIGAISIHGTCNILVDGQSVAFLVVGSG